MKHLFSFLIVISLMVNVTQAHAATATLGMQIVQNVSDVASKGFNLITSKATFAETQKTIILDPLANILIATTQQQVVNIILTWTKSGFQGNPLVLLEPQKWIKQKGLDQVTINLNYVPKGDMYSDSIFGAITAHNKDITVKTQLEALSKSNLPSILQKSICDPTTLLATAQNETRNNDGSVNTSAASARQTQLSNELCSGDPANDPALAAKLTSAAEQNPSLGGWDAFLAIGDGENEYYRTTRANYVAAKDRADRVDQEVADTKTENTISDTKCLEREPISGKCTRQVVATPSSVVKSSVTAGANAGLDRINNLQGWGALTAALTQFATQFLMKGITSAFNSTDVTANTARITASSTASASTNIILSGPEATTEVVGTINDQFTSYSTMLTKLDRIDTDYVTFLAGYSGKISEGRSCLSGILRTYPSASVHPTYVAIKGQYDAKENALTLLINSLNKEKASIGQAQGLITSTRSQISTTSDAETISTLYMSFRDKITQNNFPSDTADATREGEYQMATQVNAESENAQYSDLLLRCNNLQRELDASNASLNNNAGLGGN